MTTRHLLAALLLAAAPIACLQAAPADIAAAVAFDGRPAEARALDDSRKPAEVLRFLGLAAGDRVLDVMTGGGYYAELMGRAVGPKGSVVALEPPMFLSDKGKVKWAALTARTPNVELLPGMPVETDLAPNSFDFALLHLVYHDFYWESAEYKYPRMDPDAALQRLYAAMKPGGVVGVVDHVAKAGDTRETADELHRIDPATVKADFLRAGFVLDGESQLLRMPSDDGSKPVFDPAVRGKTDRILYRFRKPT